MNKGFTLIELLVVVLIIGILAAIALPQYQKAVERSRMAEAFRVLGDLASAQQIYYMQHNAFAVSVNDLNKGDVSFALPEGGAYSFAFEGGPDHAGMYADRVSGMYAGGWLGIEIDPDGSIRKSCQNPSDQPGFCTMAESAGYSLEDLSGGEHVADGDGGESCPVHCICESSGKIFCGYQ